MIKNRPTNDHGVLRHPAWMKERAGASAFVGTPQYAILHESLRAPCIAGHPHCSLRGFYN
jgi:hypothetical protein